MRLGTVSFQTNDKMDVFHVALAIEDGIEQSDEALHEVEDTQFDSDKAWVTGNVPKIKPVNIEGDTTIISAWFKGESFDGPFVINVYVECELAEELEDVVTDEKTKQDSSLEPIEIHL
jgi:hypothetical protein